MRGPAPLLTPGAPATVDQEIEARFCQGDRQAFLAVYAAFAPTVRALVGRFFARAFEREEAAQEVWLLVHRMAATFDPSRGSLLPWLRVVAANRCKELLRAQGRRPDPRTELDEDGLTTAAAPTAAATAGRPEETLGAARLQGAVERFVAQLSAEEARVFRLSLIEERTHEDVARAIGISARRCKYLRMKLLLRLAGDATMRQALREVAEP